MPSEEDAAEGVAEGAAEGATDPFARLGQCDHLCFGGGGMKALNAYVAALYCLERRVGERWREHAATRVRTYSGASAGAIFALAMAVGLDADRIFELLAPPCSNFRSVIPNPDVSTLWEGYGLERGDVLRSLVGQVLRAGGLSEETTFERLHALARVDFACSGTNLTRHAARRFDRASTPRMPVAHACFISMCVPILFAPAVHEDELYVDGALSDNFPLGADARPERAAVWCIAPPTRQRVGSWSDYTRALVSVGGIAQEARARALRAEAAMFVCFMERGGEGADEAAVDVDVDEATLARFRGYGYAGMSARLQPKLAGVVAALVLVALLCGKRVDEDARASAPCQRRRAEEEEGDERSAVCMRSR